MRRLLRAASAGVSLGLLASAIALGRSAASRLMADCGVQAPAECALEAELARAGARVELFMALGCLTLCAGLVLALRRSPIWAPPRS